MGVVYKARQKALGRLVALKLLAPERVGDPKFAERFTHEAKALAALSHPSIVTIHDFGQAGGFYYLLMEFVDGVNLRQAMKAGRFTPEQALAIVPPVCEALQYAHEHGIVHRDIKPENLLLDKEGRVKIADFGIAKILGAESSGVGMSESQPAGTPQYMAPEQKEHRTTDHRADIYSLGVVLYEMLTGELPADKLQPPSKRVQVDVRIDEIVLRALEKTPDLRYQTAVEFRTQVEAAVGQEASASPSSKPDDAIVPPRFSLAAVVGAWWVPVTIFSFVALNTIMAAAGAVWAKMFVAFYAHPSVIGDPHIQVPLMTRLANWLLLHNELGRLAIVGAAIVLSALIVFAVMKAVRGGIFSPPTGSCAAVRETKTASSTSLTTRLKLLISLAITVPLVVMSLIKVANGLPAKLGWFPVWVLLTAYALIWLLPWIAGMASGRDSARWYDTLALAAVWWFASMPVIFWLADIPRIQNTQWLALMLLVVASPIFVGLAARFMRRCQAAPNGLRWIKAWAWAGWCLAVPAVGFAAFFIHAAATESGGWNPSPNEMWAVPLIMLAALSLPPFSAGLWHAAGGGKKTFTGMAMSAIAAITVVVLSMSGGMAARPWLLRSFSAQQAFKVNVSPEGVIGRVVHVRVSTPDPQLSQEMRMVLEGPDGDKESRLIPRGYAQQPRPSHFVFPRPSPANQPWTDFGSAKDTLVAFVLPTEELAAEAYRRLGSGHLNLDRPKPQGVIHFYPDPRKPETMICTLFEVADSKGRHFTGSLRFSAELIREGHPRWAEVRSLPTADSLNTLELSWEVRSAPPAAMTLKHRWKDGGSESMGVIDSKGVMSVGDHPPGNTKFYQQRISVLLYKISDTRVGLRLMHGTQPNTKEFDGDFATLAEEMRTAPLSGLCKTERDWDIELCRVAGSAVTLRVADPPPPTPVEPVEVPATGMITPPPVSPDTANPTTTPIPEARLWQLLPGDAQNMAEVANGIFGKLTDQAGKPIPNRAILLAAKPIPKGEAGLRQVLTKADGTFTADLSPSEMYQVYILKGDGSDQNEVPNRSHSAFVGIPRGDRDKGALNLRFDGQKVEAHFEMLLWGESGQGPRRPATARLERDGSASPQRTGAANAAPAFGPVVERTLNDPSESLKDCLISLDSGALQTLPEVFKGALEVGDPTDKILLDWASQPGLFVDAAARVTMADGSITQFGLRTFHLLAIPIEADLADKLTADQVLGKIQEKLLAWSFIRQINDLMTDGKKPAAFVFQTRSGLNGILQIIGPSDNPRGVKIRFKLVQKAGAANGQSASIPQKIDFKFPPASINGRLLDAQGKPVAQRRILILNPIMQATHQQPQIFAEIRTGDDGGFSAGLPVGKPFVVVMPRNSANNGPRIKENEANDGLGSLQQMIGELGGPIGQPPMALVGDMEVRIDADELKVHFELQEVSLATIQPAPANAPGAGGQAVHIERLPLMNLEAVGAQWYISAAKPGWIWLKVNGERIGQEMTNLETGVYRGGVILRLEKHGEAQARLGYGFTGMSTPWGTVDLAGTFEENAAAFRKLVSDPKGASGKIARNREAELLRIQGTTATIAVANKSESVNVEDAHRPGAQASDDAQQRLRALALESVRQGRPHRRPLHPARARQDAARTHSRPRDWLSHPRAARQRSCSQCPLQ